MEDELERWAVVERVTTGGWSALTLVTLSEPERGDAGWRTNGLVGGSEVERLGLLTLEWS
jgi:hypothetical protein